jgi:hypothetical protein
MMLSPVPEVATNQARTGCTHTEPMQLTPGGAQLATACSQFVRTNIKHLIANGINYVPKWGKLFRRNLYGVRSWPRARIGKAT